MKGGVGGGIAVSSFPPSTKRRWRGLVIAVLGLVILSMLVPLVFLLGLHNGFHSAGSVHEQQNSVPNGLGGYDQPRKNNHSYYDYSQLHDSRSARNQSKEFQKQSVEAVVNKTGTRGSLRVLQPPGGHPGRLNAQKVSPKPNSIKVSGSIEVLGRATVVDESELSCELRFGSYCFWSHEYREDMKDSMVKRLKDRLFVARAYYPSIAKLPVHEKLSREIRQNIQDFERILSEATSDADLPPGIVEKLQKMETAIARAKSVPVDCSNVDKKFRQLVDLTEDEANFHMKQSAFLYQLAVQTMPKSLHCLSMRLTVSFFHSPSLDVDVSLDEKFVDPSLYHCVVLSNNILGSSVVINSTVMHAKESRKLVFHVLTDRHNYFAMKLWFSRSIFREATVQVLNIEDHDVSHLSLPEEFRVSIQNSHKLPKGSHWTEYLSLFSYSHYLLPEIFHNLDRLVIMDDDILVQQDLSPLWSINMEGKVNGAVELCAVRLVQLNSYMGSHSFNKNTCAWMSGLNVVDLVRWRELNLTEVFKRLAQELDAGSRHFGAVASRASLLTFQDLVYALDRRWVLSGLGYDYKLDELAMRKAAVLHYNGNMKPWLELGIPKYRSLWTRFLNREEKFLRECNVIP
ncbi:hypothetical protein Nepgr_011629 [Nepenthes gracilis]|uniref:Hexosyltransferase n=1 Tax=Nepenthes gracilis TaxID=150966 RepID=A0AAD3SEP6_NEPGR|nr:hypothetical protein Nepgr_011629 [Nepenthes gracilis]